jgi:hypothetical protein
MYLTLKPSVTPLGLPMCFSSALEHPHHLSSTLLASNLSLKCIKIVNKKGWPFVFKVKRVRVDEGVGQN